MLMYSRYMFDDLSHLTYFVRTLAKEADSLKFSSKYLSDPTAIDSYSIEPLPVLHSKLEFEW